MNKVEIVAAILCGGASRRMGSDKARLPHPEGGTLLERAVLLAASCTGEVLLLSGDGRRYPELGMPELPDARADCGPLGGLVAALRHARGGSVLMLPVDMAALTEEGLATLLAGFGDGELPVVARGAKRRHPALSIWPAGSRFAAESALNAERLALHPLLEQLDAVDVMLPDAALVNWNRPEDLER